MLNKKLNFFASKDVTGFVVGSHIC